MVEVVEALWAAVETSQRLSWGLVMWPLQEVLRKLRQRLGRLAKTAEDFREMASEHWAPRIGAYICAAHWLAHSLQEAAGSLLLLDLEGALLKLIE